MLNFPFPLTTQIIATLFESPLFWAFFWSQWKWNMSYKKMFWVFFKYFWTVYYYTLFLLYYNVSSQKSYNIWHVILIILLKVSRVLPDWLSSPNVIASDLKQKTTLVSEFKGLDPDIHLNLKENKIDYFFPGIYLFFYC